MCPDIIINSALDSTVKSEEMKTNFYTRMTINERINYKAAEQRFVKKGTILDRCLRSIGVKARMKATKKQVTAFNCGGFSLEVLHEGNVGISWDFPVKPGDKVSTEAIQEILSKFSWSDMVDYN